MKTTFWHNWKETIVLWYGDCFYSKKWHESEVVEIDDTEKEKIDKWEKFELKNKKISFSKK